MTDWYCIVNGEREGPQGIDALIARLNQLSNPRAIAVWSAGMDDWVPASEVPELFRRLAPAMPLPTTGKGAIVEPLERTAARSLPQDCPNCHLLNPPGSLRCECGYSFHDRRMAVTTTAVGDSTTTVSKVVSAASVGIDAVNLIRRSRYDLVDGHEALRLEVVDDMKLGASEMSPSATRRQRGLVAAGGVLLLLNLATCAYVVAPPRGSPEVLADLTAAALRWGIVSAVLVGLIGPLRRRPAGSFLVVFGVPALVGQLLIVQADADAMGRSAQLEAKLHAISQARTELRQSSDQLQRSKRAVTIEDFVAMYREMRPFLGQWRQSLNAIRAMIEDYQRIAAGAPQPSWKSWKEAGALLDRAYRLDIEELELIEHQARLIEALDSMPQASRVHYFNTKVRPLLDAEAELEAKREAAQQALRAELMLLAK